ncbi:transporter substrate-binding domain-containing protein [Bacillus horti]|uniref:histidine kinase n=1 Tax=Caldalkalibacillus horti TaxID=77523 RepID=A0ABT9VTX6_9BACI|nr:transporter substrate-binding domain-containing protein [Bacillus horti]MDQ0164436.1 polar amino acid transport system substrate-binding protein [Bacillus horti]
MKREQFVKRTSSRKKWNFTIAVAVCCVVAAVITIPYMFDSFLKHHVYARDLSLNNQAGEEPSPLRIGFDPLLPPYQFEELGEYKGFNIDIMKSVADWGDLTLEWVPVRTGDKVQALKEERVDVLLGVPYRANYVDDINFTERYYTSEVGMLVPVQHSSTISNLAELSERIVALEKDTLEYEFLQNIRRIKYHVTSNQRDAFRLLLEGRADAFVGNAVTAEKLLEEYGVQEHFIFVDRYVMPIEYTMAVRQQDYSLLQFLNEGLNEIKVQGTYKQIHEQWFVDEHGELQQRMEMMIRIITISGLFIGCIFFLGICWNRQLKKQVRIRTEDVNQLNESLAIRATEVKNSDQLTKQILESSPRAIVTIDRAGIITSMNEKATHTMNLKSKVNGVSYKLNPVMKEVLDSKIRDILDKGKQFHGEIESHTLSGNRGEEVYLRYYAYPLNDYQKKISGVILSFEDITDERHLRDQMFEQEKSRALSQLVAGIAHEIRNPLTSIKTFVELIPNKIQNLRFQEEISHHVPKEIERLNELIEGLIDYAKPAGQKFERINVASFIESAAPLFLKAVEIKGYKVETILKPDLEIKVDPNQLKQVLINLIINSVEALDEKERVESESSYADITIRSWNEEGHAKGMVYIQVTDQGIGMSEKQIKRVMEPFYTTKSNGVGLGLALSYQYIKENNGEMEIESIVGKGTTVTLSFRREK